MLTKNNASSILHTLCHGKGHHKTLVPVSFYFIAFVLAPPPHTHFKACHVKVQNLLSWIQFSQQLSKILHQTSQILFKNITSLVIHNRFTSCSMDYKSTWGLHSHYRILLVRWALSLVSVGLFTISCLDHSCLHVVLSLIMFWAFPALIILFYFQSV